MRRILLAWAFLLGSFAALAQPAPIETTRAQLDQAARILGQIEASFARPDLSEAQLAASRAQLDPLPDTINGIIGNLGPRLSEIKARLDQLGPPPAEGQPAESPGVSQERADQQRQFNDIDETLKRARLLAVQTEQVGSTIASRRRALFARAIFQRSFSVASPALWATVWDNIPRDIQAIRILSGEWLTAVRSNASGLRVLAAAALLLAVAVFLRPLLRMARRVVPRDDAIASPSASQKALAAIWTVLVLAAVPIAVLAGAVAALEAFGFLIPRFQPVYKAMIDGIVRVSLAIAIAHGVLAPRRPKWRPVALSDETSERLFRLVLVVAFIISSAKILEALLDIIAAVLASTVAVRGLASLAVAVVLVRGLKGIAAIEPDDGGNEGAVVPAQSQRRDWFAPLRLVMWAVIAAITIATLTGYVAFGAFLVDQIVWIGGIGALLFLLLRAVNEGLDAGLQPGTRFSRTLSGGIGLRRASLDQVAAILSGAVSLMLCIAAVMLALAPWGIQSDDMFGYVRAAFFGFQVGDLTISLSTIAMAVVLFLAGVLLTRLVQNWLDARLLPRTQLDKSLRSSIRTSLGYAGFIVAAMVALSYMGLGLERLALVAGALSVGIGFGLQSIVSNFVSGLIILWERAVRVGDWIEVGPEQGFVRRINVRSTEIETFDRAVVIVPNANLISGVVKNWVRGDRVGRIKIPVSVAYDSDPEKVRETLVAIAKKHTLVIPIPAPQVLFVSFEGTLKFELVCFLQDVEQSARVKSELHFEIFRQLRENRVASPFTPAVPGALDKIAAAIREEVDRRAGARGQEGGDSGSVNPDAAR